MRISEIVVTDGERHAAQNALVQTETTDAVNAGLVGRADKSDQALKAELYSKESDSIGAKQTSQNLRYRNSAEIELAEEQQSINLHNAITDRVTASALKDTEVEGVDDVYRSGTMAVKAVKNAQNRLAQGEVDAGKATHDVSAGSSANNQHLGQLSQKKYQSTKLTEDVQKVEQAKRNQAMSRSIAQANETRRAAWLGAGATSGSSAVGVGGAKAVGGTAAAPALGFIVIIIAIAFSLVALTTLIGSIANAEENKHAIALSENEATVAQYLLGKELDPLHVAAIMGNIEAESGFNPGGVEAGNAIGHGLCQWSFGRWSQLQAFAAAEGKEWYDINLQLDFLWAELTGEGAAAAYTNVQYNHAGFMQTTSLEDAVYYFGRNFERPNETYAHWDRRIQKAQQYYAALTGAGADTTGRISEAQKHLGKPYVWGATGPGGFDCSGFVYYVLNQTGYSTSRLTAEGYYNMCTKITEKEAQPGDLIFFRGTYGSPNFISHIGFYMGDGQMIHAGDPVSITSFKTDYWQSHSPEFGRLP